MRARVPVLLHGAAQTAPTRPLYARCGTGCAADAAPQPRAALRRAPAGPTWGARARRAPRLEVNKVDELVGLRDRARGLALRLGGLAALLVRNHGRKAAAALLQPHRLHARVARRQHLRGRGRAREAAGACLRGRCGRRARAPWRACATPGAGQMGAGRSQRVSGDLQTRGG